MSTVRVVLYPKAEDYTQEALAKIDINIGPVGAAYRGIREELLRIAKGGKIFSSIYIEGLYGSGKTLVLRKLVYDLVSGPEKSEFEKVIPIYFFLGVMDFNLLDGLEGYVGDVKAYINGEIPHKSNIIGKREDWKVRMPAIEMIEEIIKNIKGKYKDDGQKQVLGFFEVLRELNKKGYYPLVIFDEFERVIYTGDGLRSRVGMDSFALFATRYLELTRGHIYSGIFTITTTKSIDELVKLAEEEKRPHISEVFERLGIKNASEFPMIRPHIVYDRKYVLKWISSDLKILANKYGLPLCEELLDLISTVLPTPRAIVQINTRLGEILPEKKPDVITLTDFYKLIESRIAELLERLKKERIDGRYLIAPRARWPDRFMKLLSSGHFVIKSTRYEEIAKTLEISTSDTRKDRQKVSNIAQILAELGLFEAVGAGEYRLNPIILAYGLEINRLPDGSEAKLDEVINKIKSAIKEKREKRRKYREREKKEEEQGQVEG